MIIAVIGNYELPQYKEFLKKVQSAKPEEDILDLSRHPGYNWSKKLKARFEDICSSHQVIISNDYLDSLDARRDVTYAQERKRDCMIYTSNGEFRPFPQYAERI